MLEGAMIRLDYAKFGASVNSTIEFNDPFANVLTIKLNGFWDHVFVTVIWQPDTMLIDEHCTILFGAILHEVQRNCGLVYTSLKRTRLSLLVNGHNTLVNSRNGSEQTETHNHTGERPVFPQYAPYDKCDVTLAPGVSLLDLRGGGKFGPSGAGRSLGRKFAYAHYDRPNTNQNDRPNTEHDDRPNKTTHDDRPNEKTGRIVFKRPRLPSYKHPRTLPALVRPRDVLPEVLPATVRPRETAPEFLPRAREPESDTETDGAGVWTAAERRDNNRVEFVGELGLLDMGGGGGSSDNGRSEDLEAGSQFLETQRRTEEPWKPTFNASAGRWARPDGTFMTETAALEQLADWRLAQRTPAKDPRRPLRVPMNDNGDEGSDDESDIPTGIGKMYLGSSPAPIEALEEMARGQGRLHARVAHGASWLRKLRTFVEASDDHGEFLWKQIRKSAGEWHERWIALASSTWQQASLGPECYTLSECCGQLDRKVKTALLGTCRRMSSFVAKALKAGGIAAEATARADDEELDAFQRFVQFVVVVRMRFDVRTPIDKIALLRKVEHPLDWVTGTDGAAAPGELRAWVRLVRHVDELHTVAWGRVFLGVQYLFDHVHKATTKVRDQSELLRAFEHAGLDDWTADGETATSFVTGLANFAEFKNVNIGKTNTGREAGSTSRNEHAPEARSTAAGRPETTPPGRRATCYVCKKPRTAHADGRFCPPKPHLCNVCGKAPSEHPPTQRYPKGQFCARPNGKSPS
jgi:hypothetical protein